MSDQQLPDIKARFVMDLTGLTRVEAKARDLGGELDNLGKGGDPIAARFRGSGAELDRLGTKLSIGVTLPLAALGVKALNASREFDGAFARMVSLAGVAADEVDGLKESVLKLGGETGRKPTELADALYFARSAGLDAATAMDVVESSARAAAIGLGRTDQIVDAVTSALGAYGPANLSASRATDVLTAAARSAKIEAAELAPQLGRLLPTASQLKVPFDEVAAAVAFLSQKSGNASLSATQLDGVLRKLLIPSQQGREALEQMGLSAEGLRKIVAEQGLEGALALLKERIGGNSDTLALLFDDIQAAQGAMLLLDDATGGLGAAFDATANSAGTTSTAFDEFAQSDAFKRDQDLANLQAALISLGEILIPIAGDILGAASDIAAGFASLPGPIQQAIVVAGLFAFSAGPLIKAGRGIAESVDLARKGMTKLSDSGAGLAGLGPIALGVAGAAVIAGLAFKGWADRQQEAADAARAVSIAVDDMTQSLNDSIITSVQSTIESKNQSDDLTRAGISYREFGRAVTGGGEALEALRRKLIESEEIRQGALVGTDAARLSQDQLNEAWIRGEEVSGAFTNGNKGLVQTLDDLINSTRESGTVQVESAVALGALTAAEGEALLATGDYAKAVDAANHAIAQQEAALNQAAPTVQLAGQIAAALADHQTDLAEETDESAEALADYRGELDLATAVMDGFKSALDRLLGVNLDVEESYLGMIEAAAELTKQLEENGGTLDVNTEAGVKNRRQILDTTGAVVAHAEALVRQDGDTKRATETLGFYSASLRDQLIQAGLSEEAVDSYLETLGLTPEQIATTITAIGVDIEKEKVEALLTELDKLPDEVTSEIRALIDQGAFAEAQRQFAILTAPEEKVITVRQHAVPGTIRVSSEGNRLRAHEPSVVGEKGRELFVPEMPGRVLPSNVVDALERTLDRGDRAVAAAGNSYTLQIYPASSVVFDETEVLAQLRMMELLNG